MGMVLEITGTSRYFRCRWKQCNGKSLGYTRVALAKIPIMVVRDTEPDQAISCKQARHQVEALRPQPSYKTFNL